MRVSNPRPSGSKPDALPPELPRIGGRRGIRTPTSLFGILGLENRCRYPKSFGLPFHVGSPGRIRTYKNPRFGRVAYAIPRRGHCWYEGWDSNPHKLVSKTSTSAFPPPSPSLRTEWDSNPRPRVKRPELRLSATGSLVAAEGLEPPIFALSAHCFTS